MIRSGLVLIFLSLQACGLFKPEVVYRDRIKEVPLLVFDTPPPPVKVDSAVLPVDELKPESKDDETATAYRRSIIILKSENAQLREALKPYEKSE